VKIHIIDDGTKYIDNLTKSLALYRPSLVGYSEIDKSTIRSEDLVILSGGHGYPVLWHEKEYGHEIDIIKNHPGPIVGICLGFQLIAHVFGSHLHLHPRGTRSYFNGG
jgi:GMP synthase-like glutamine amidotransferase